LRYTNSIIIIIIIIIIISITKLTETVFVVPTPTG